MKITSRFTVAVHTLLVINYFSKSEKVTSDFIAASVQVNPVVIRRSMQDLKAAGLIDVKYGSGGSTLTKELKDITLYDVYRAVDAVDTQEGGLFHFHENPNPKCPVGKNIHLVLDDHLIEAQRAMEQKLQQVSLQMLAEKIK